MISKWVHWWCSTCVVLTSMCAVLMPPRTARADPRSRVIFGGQLLVPLRESATYGASCSAPGSTVCADGTSFSYDTEEVTGGGRLDVEGFALLRLSDSTRVGLAVTLHPGLQFASVLSGKSRGFGTGLDPMVVGEWLPQVTSEVRWLLQGRIGFRTLFAGSDLSSEINDLKEICGDATAKGWLCSVDDGPYTGFALGVGTGLLWTPGAITWRAQLLLTVTEIDHLARVQMSGAGGTFDADGRLGGGDGWTTLSLAIGAEL